MDRLLTEMMEDISSGDVERGNAAVSRLAMLLESTRGGAAAKTNDNQELYNTVLSPDLRALALTAEVHEQIVMTLRGMLRIQRLQPSIVWAIGKAMPVPGLRALLDLIADEGDRISEETRYQLCIALHDLLEFASLSCRREAFQLLASKSPVRVLRAIAESSGPRAAESAAAALAEVERAIGRGPKGPEAIQGPRP